MLKAMANLIRPATERRTRHHKSRSPPPAEAVETSAQSPPRPLTHTAISTRKTSRTTPVALDDEPNAKIAEQHTETEQAAPVAVRTSSRKRRASAISDSRPPVKIAVTRPHGELLSITNGVSKKLDIQADEVPSGTSTPRPNGLRAPSTGSQDKRSLRSQDGSSRLKSDLAIYFSSYDDIIAGVEKPPEFLDLDTPIYLVDEPVKSFKSQDAPTSEASRKSASPTRLRKSRAHTPTRKASTTSIPPSQSSTSYQVLDYSSIAKHLRHDGDEDPLADSVFFAQHRRAERKEKQLRNIEKERAMHEKVQLERLLDGLQGPDWLKVMGITGVTDGERKEWEPKRAFFVKEVETLVDKFRMWKEQEKRVRAEKEAAQAAQEEDEEEEEEEEESESEPEPKKANAKHPVSSTSHSKDAETLKPRRPPRPHGFLLPFIPPEPAEPFTSFYSKPHLRAAALGKHRHGRNATAFGHPVPEWEEQDFELPDDFVTPEFLRDNARKRRRRKRESGVAS